MESSRNELVFGVLNLDRSVLQSIIDLSFERMVCLGQMCRKYSGMPRSSVKTELLEAHFLREVLAEIWL